MPNSSAFSKLFDFIIDNFKKCKFNLTNMLKKQTAVNY